VGVFFDGIVLLLQEVEVRGGRREKIRVTDPPNSDLVPKRPRTGNSLSLVVAGST